MKRIKLFCDCNWAKIPNAVLGEDITQATPDISFELSMRLSVSQKPCLLHYHHTIEFHFSSIPSSLSITFSSPNPSWYVWYCLTFGICIKQYFLPYLYSKSENLATIFVTDFLVSKTESAVLGVQLLFVFSSL